MRSFLSREGIHWEEEEGVRLRAKDGEQVTDPFVVRWKGVWKMYFKTEPRGGGAAAKKPRTDQPGPWDADGVVGGASLGMDQGLAPDGASRSCGRVRLPVGLSRRRGGSGPQSCGGGVALVFPCS